ncbi:MAG: DEAD/DEAH box helicase, partial [Candidatus Heimdallarchaeaceae archaeon]
MESYREKNRNRSTSEILSSIPIIVSTTSTISNPLFERLGINTIIIDEASQMTEPTALSSLLEGNRFILVGDHKQLPPVVQSIKAQNEGLSISLFERLASAHPKTVHMLTQQYRMNEKIIEYPNLEYYQGKLQSFDDSIRNQNLSELNNYTREFENFDLQEIYDPSSPLVFIPVLGNFLPDKKLNKKEARLVGEVVTNFLKTGVNTEQIAVICPYRGQAAEIRKHVPPGVPVDTVDRFQGSDREIILLSLTETGSSGKRGFDDERRLNVAITRAKKKLIVIGHPNIEQKNLTKYVDYLKRKATIPETLKDNIQPRHIKYE